MYTLVLPEKCMIWTMLRVFCRSMNVCSFRCLPAGVHEHAHQQAQECPPSLAHCQKVSSFRAGAFDRPALLYLYDNWP